MILNPSGLSPTPTFCEAGLGLLHEHLYAVLPWGGGFQHVALCVSIDEETAVHRGQDFGPKGIVTDLQTAESFELWRYPGMEPPEQPDALMAIRLPFDDRRIQ